MIADQLQTFGKPGVAGHAHPAFASMNMLVIVQAENTNVTNRAAKRIKFAAERCLGIIFDKVQPLGISQCPQLGQPCRMTKQVDRQDRFGFWRDCGAHGFDVETERLILDINENRNGAIDQRRHRSCGHCRARHDNLVPRPHTDGAHGGKQA